MSTDDFLRDQVERTLRQRTRRRRDGRSRRRGVYLILGVAFVLMFALGSPSLVSHSSLGRSLLGRTISGYGLEATVDAMRIGWITPLKVNGLSIHGKSGSEITVGQLDLDMTVVDMIRSLGGDLGQIAVRGVNVNCTISDGRCSLEEDLAQLIESGSNESSTSATIHLQDVTVSVTDSVEGGTWQISQTSADVDLTPKRTQAAFAGMLTEPSGSSGSLQGSIEFIQSGPQRTSAVGSDGVSPSAWRIDLQSESLPLSVVSLVRRRFPALTTSIPHRVHGDATGGFIMASAPDGVIEMSVRDLNVRNFSAADAGSRAWSNRLATLDGDLVLVGNRVIGRQLRASADFATATVNGAFSRSFSLVGANDNPLRWLEAIDGSATVDVNLAELDRSLPGVLPLRADAELVTGSVVAQVDSKIDRGVRQCHLHVSSDALRARAGGRVVVIDPMELNAIVSSDGGPLRADHFNWKSAFGSAVGNGDLRSGNADVEIDFGRLTSMLQPIVQVSESTMAGNVRANIGWNASRDDVWQLSGRGDASNLIVTLPSGRTLRRPSLHGEIDAVGRWGGQALQELTRASANLTTSGTNIDAQLVSPVAQPTSTSELPLRIKGSGNIETLIEILGPWLPNELHRGSGGFRVYANAEVSTVSAKLKDTVIDLSEPRFALGTRYFRQPNVKIEFDGEYSWPANQLLARKLTFAGDALSLVAQGDLNPNHFDVDIKWRAKLERIQGSVKTRVTALPGTRVQQVSFDDSSEDLQNIESDRWLVIGDCAGDMSVLGQDGRIDLVTQLSATDLAIVQPSNQAAGLQHVGPMPRDASAQASGARGARNTRGRVVWAEPNLSANGSIRLMPRDGTLTTNSVEIVGDWFAATLSGSVSSRQGDVGVRLAGPARLKMDQVASRLSTLSGVDIRAVGFHESPIEISVHRSVDGVLGFEVLGNMGWEASQVAGIDLGPASIPVRMTETSVDIAPAFIPVGDGRLNLAGQVHYRPGPLWMRLDRGVVAESIRLTPEITDRWLKYLAPMIANSARVDGTIGVELDEAVIVIDQPRQSRVVGRLNIAGAQMTAGPLTDQIIGGIAQLRQLARVISGLESNVGEMFAQSNSGSTLVTMPSQTVDFSVDQGMVQHDRLSLEIDRAQVMTSGQVSMDGRLNMYAQVQLDSRWLGSDLQGLTGQSVTLPIDGTLTRPSLDSSGVQRLVAEFGIKAVESTAENYLQKQLGRGLDRILGR